MFTQGTVFLLPKSCKIVISHTSNLSREWHSIALIALKSLNHHERQLFAFESFAEADCFHANVHSFVYENSASIG